MFIHRFFKHLQRIILDLKGCMEVMREKLVLFTLYDISVSLFLKPVVTYSGSQMWTAECIVNVFVRHGNCW